MSPRKKPQAMRCAIYTRKSTEEGLEQEFNTLDAQREAGRAYVSSQKQEGWVVLPQPYDDGGFTGANIDRPAMQRLLADIEAGKVDCVVVYKVDRLSRSLLDFARLMETFEKNQVSFVSVTQQFNTANSMGRLVLNVLLSFAQFEREIIAERTRDKIAAARRKGKYTGGTPVLGYDVVGGRLVVHPKEARTVRQIFELYRQVGSLLGTVREMERRGWRTKSWTTRKGHVRGGGAIRKNNLHALLTNVVYLGMVRHQKQIYRGEHEAIVPQALFQEVRARLREGRCERSGLLRAEPSLLKGLLHCAACHSTMGPTYAQKKVRRYRYYVCNKPPNGNRDPCPAPSLPAVALERYVVAEVQKALGRPNGNGETGDPRKLVRDHVARVDYDGRSGAIAITLRSEEDGP